MSETKKALGRKSRQLQQENRARVFLTIAKKPLAFSELLKETKLSRATLSHHLKALEKEDFIYRDIIKPTQARSHPSEIGKVVYKIKEDEMREILMETVMVSLSVIQGVFEDQKLNEKIRYHARELTKLIVDYINDLRARRERALKREVKRLKETK